MRLQHSVAELSSDRVSESRKAIQKLGLAIESQDDTIACSSLAGALGSLSRFDEALLEFRSIQHHEVYNE